MNCVCPQNSNLFYLVAMVNYELEKWLWTCVYMILCDYFFSYEW